MANADIIQNSNHVRLMGGANLASLKALRGEDRPRRWRDRYGQEYSEHEASVGLVAIERGRPEVTQR